MSQLLFMVNTYFGAIFSKTSISVFIVNNVTIEICLHVLITTLEVHRTWTAVHRSPLWTWPSLGPLNRSMDHPYDLPYPVVYVLN